MNIFGLKVSHGPKLFWLGLLGLGSLCTYWVCAESLHFHTEYMQKVVCFILSVHRKIFRTILTINWKQFLLMATHTSKDNFIGKSKSFHITLSIRRKYFVSYWVYAESLIFHTEYKQKNLLNYTEYKLEANFDFGQTKPPLAQFKSLLGKNPCLGCF